MPKRKHVLCFAFPAFGHYIPMLELAKRIIPHHDVTMVISSTKEPTIRQRNLLPPPPIGFHTVNDHISVNLDEEFTELPMLINVVNDVKPYFTEFIKSLNSNNSPLPHVDAVFCDITQHAPCKPCHEKGIPVYIVNVLPTFLMAKSFTVHEDTRAVPDETFFNEELLGIKTEDWPIQESIKTLSLGHHNACKDAAAILFNSFAELEQGALELFQQNPRTKDQVLKFIGPLIMAEEESTSDELTDKVSKWMNKQADKSVAYLSFGTVAAASHEQIAEVAKALTSLKRPFIWSLRPFQQVHLPADIKTTTAEDFDMDAKYLIIPWAPQKKILSHNATAVFVSHCGWNSTLEAVYFGVPVVAWPMFGDQFSNAALVDRLGVGLTVKGAGMHKKEPVAAADIVHVIETAAGWNNQTDHGTPTYAERMESLGRKAKAALEENGESNKSLLEILEKI